MWCDDFDADLPKIVPGAKSELAETADLVLVTYSRQTDGKINCPSAWNTWQGLASFFWFRDGQPPPASYYTNDPICECTFWEAVRDLWVHKHVMMVENECVWRPGSNRVQRAFFSLMYGVRRIPELVSEPKEESHKTVLRTLEVARDRMRRLVVGHRAKIGDRP